MSGRTLAMGAAILAVGAALASEDRPARVPASGLVLLVGDSHAEGLATLGALGAALKAKGLGFRSAYQRGTGATYWDPRFPQLLAAFRPAVVLLSLGGNDFGRTDPANVNAAIVSLVNAARKAGVRLVWLEPTTMPFPDPHDVRGMWSATGVETYPTLTLEPLPRVDDKIHLTAAGYQRWAKALAEYLA